MNKTYFIPGMQPSTGGTGEERNYPSLEQLKRRHPDYYRTRGDISEADFAEKGERVKIHGDEAEVMHVEHNSDGTQDVYASRSSALDSGTTLIKVEPDKNRKQQIRKIKRTFD